MPHQWETFYVIVGSAAAALTGLQFVVIALGANRRSVHASEAVAAFATPTVVHFCSVLTIAAATCMPGLSTRLLAGIVAAAGMFGVVYTIITARRARRQQDYKPVLEDWLWHVAFPFVAYLALVLTFGELYVAGMAALFLLFIGIHNAWDAAVYMSTLSGDEP